MRDNMENWFEFDEKKDLLSSLRMVNFAVTEVQADPSFWKWVIIGVHNALQASMVIHLSSIGNDLLVADEKTRACWEVAYEHGELLPELKMDTFLNLYKKIKKIEIFGYKFKPECDQGNSIRRINTIRNEYVHFVPKTWLVQKSGLPRICCDCLKVITILSNIPTSDVWENETQSTEYQILINSCITTLSSLQPQTSINSKTASASKPSV